MNPLKKEQLNYPVHDVVLQSIDNFIQNGNGMNILHRNKSDYKKTGINYVDIERATFVRFLVSSYGSIETNISNKLYQQLIENDEKTSYVTIRTKNPGLIRQNATRRKRIVNAMVYMQIPIEGYFNGKSILNPN